MSFEVDINWLDSAETAPEIKVTSAQLIIRVNKCVLTRAEDVFARTVNDSVRVSAYPLALWVASNWWRLRWESAPEFVAIVPHEWRMCHELPAIGFGYVWPVADLSSDGKLVTVRARRATQGPSEPLHYLEQFTEECPASDYERGIDQFVDLVVARLTDSSVAGTDLQELWPLVRAERNDPQKSFLRLIEARLGLDPDDAPDLVLKFVAFAQTCGRAALEELAAGNPGGERNAYYADIARLAQVSGHVGAFTLPRLQQATLTSAPWERGREVAHSVRHQLALNGAPLSNVQLGEMLGLVASTFEGRDGNRTGPAVAIPRDSDAVKFVFQKNVPSGRRFEAARLLGAHLMSEPQPGWHVASDAKTWRQRAQRAFAAELLAPIDSLREKLSGDFQLDSIETVAAEFAVSPFLVQSQLANHGFLDSSAVGLGRRY